MPTGMAGRHKQVERELIVSDRFHKQAAMWSVICPFMVVSSEDGVIGCVTHHHPLINSEEEADVAHWIKTTCQKPKKHLLLLLLMWVRCSLHSLHTWKNVFPSPIKHTFSKKANHNNRAENFGETDQLKRGYSQDFVIQRKPILTDVS